MGESLAPRIIVIGGGITGLAAVHRLLERMQAAHRPLDVLLLEASHRLGGVVRTEVRDGLLLEAGPDSFVTDKPWALDLCHHLGLAQELLQTNAVHRRSFVVRHGRLLPVPDGFMLLGPAKVWPFLSSPVLSVSGKCRALSEWMIPRGPDDDDESVASFVQRRFGQELFERLAEPMVRGIASADPALLSMRALLPQMLEMEQRWGSVIRALRVRARQRETAPRDGSGPTCTGPRYSLFVSFRAGMQTLVDRLTEAIPPSSVRLGVRVVCVERDATDHRWGVRLSNGETLRAEGVCVTTPSFHAGDLLRDVDRPLAEQLIEIPYTSWISVHLAFRQADVAHPMSGFGFVVPSRESEWIAGCTFAHVKFPGRAPEGVALLRAFIRGGDDVAVEPWTDDELVTNTLRCVTPWLGLRAAPRVAVVHRAPRSLPQYHVGHLDRVAAIQQRLRSLPGLVVAGNAYRGHGVTQCIASAQQTADLLFDDVMNAAVPPVPTERVA